MANIDEIKEKTQATVKAGDEATSNFVEYYFDIITSHSVTIQNNMTDNFLENNTAVQDHIAHMPIQVTLSGISGEVVYKPSRMDKNAPFDLSKVGLGRLNTPLNNFYNNVNSRFSPITNKLSPISVITPQSSNVTQLAKNIYNYSGQSVNRYVKVAKSIVGSITNRETRLKEIFRKFSILRSANTPLIVTTPYYEFQNMYIQSITLRQDEMNFTTDIELSLKQLQFANVQYTEADKNVMAMYNSYAQAKTSENGKANTYRKSMAATDWDAGHFGAALGI